MSVAAINVLKNVDLGILALPMAVPALIIRGLEEGENRFKFTRPHLSKVFTAASTPFQVINVACGLPLLIYTLAKVAFAHLFLWASCGKLPCASRFTDFENSQLTQVFKFMMFTTAGGLSSGAIDELVHFGRV